MSLFIHSIPLHMSTYPCQVGDIALKDSNPVCPDEILDVYAFFLLQELSEAVRRRVTSVPRNDILHDTGSNYVPSRVALLFSGGLDSMVLAALVHLNVNDDEPIDLINVCFDSPHHDSPDRQTAIEGFRELAHRFPQRLWQLICVDKDPTSLNSLESQYTVLELLAPCITRMDYSIGAALWFASTGRGTLERSVVRHDVSSEETLQTIRHNVFANFQSYAKTHDTVIQLRENDSRERILEQLSHFWSTTAQNLTEENTSSFSLDGQAINGNGIEQRDVQSCSPTLETVQTTSKVLLSGIGADEQLGGYGRHATAYKHRSWEGLRHEMDKDVLRLWKRNLGRDDRVISSNSREIRAPFLDENVAEFISKLDLPIITDPRLQRGTGDKRILRRVATILQIPSCATLQKRAIQFGSRVARKCNEAALGTSHRKACGSDEYKIIHPA
jgi:asparagine synthetase B (glutamine-hydrolysing)